MTSASSHSAKNLFCDSKHRLADRVNVNVNNIASVGRQIVRGSKSNDVSVVSCFTGGTRPLFYVIVCLPITGGFY